MNTEIMMGFVRHALTLGAGLLIAKGYADESTVNEVVGAVMTLVGFGWSYFHKKSASKE
jgi:hypothetical protein